MGKVTLRGTAATRLIAVFALVVGLMPLGTAAVAAATCAGETATIEGTSGPDTLIGTAGRDVIASFGGQDTIEGLGGGDLICAGAGNDTVYGHGGWDTIYLGPGNDKAYGGNGDDTIYGGEGIDTMFGNDDNDTLVGNGGGDKMYLGAGNDVGFGYAGPDLIVGSSGADKLYGGNGVDGLYGGDGGDKLVGGAKGDTMKGGSGTDSLFGGGGNDSMFGQGGNDYITGNLGIDFADGDGGIDTCFAESTVGCDPTYITADFSSVASDSCDYSSWATGPIHIDGPIYDQALYCGSDDVGDTGWIEYDLGRDYKTFKAVIGLSDYSLSDTDLFRFRVYGDGVLLVTEDIGYGDHRTLTADITDVLRMQLEITKIAGPENLFSRPAWGNAIVSANVAASVPAPAAVIPLPMATIGTDITDVRDNSCDHGSWFVDPASVNGTIYSDSLQCSVDDVGDNGFIDFILNRAYSDLDTTIGQRDDSVSSTDVIRFRIYLDGNLVRTQDVGFGAAVDVSLDVSSALRMRLEVEKVSGPINTVSRPVFGEPIVTP